VYDAARLDSWKLCARAGCLTETTPLAARAVPWLAVTSTLYAVVISALVVVTSKLLLQRLLRLCEVV